MRFRTNTLIIQLVYVRSGEPTQLISLLNDHRFIFIHFATSEYEQAVTLNVVPAPDTVIRIFMIYRPLKEAIDVVPQKLESVPRRGFIVVEWGGGEAETPQLGLK